MRFGPCQSRFSPATDRRPIARARGNARAAELDAEAGGGAIRFSSMPDTDVDLDSRTRMFARLRRRAVLSLLAIALLGLATAAGSAAADWSSGTALTDQLGNEDSQMPAVAVAPNGSALIVWRNRSNNSILYASRPAGGSFSGRSTLEAAGSSTAEDRPAVALNSAGAAVAAWTRTISGEEAVMASYRPAGGAFSSPVAISAAGDDGSAPDVAIDLNGRAVVVWSIASGSLGQRFAEASFHGSSGSFTPGDVLNGSEDTGYNLPLQAHVAMDSSGNAIAVFPSERPLVLGTINPVQWAYMPSNATSFNAPQDLGDGHTPDVAFGFSGRATVAWQKEGVIRAAEETAPAGAGFATPRRVSAVLDGSASKPDVGVDGAGTATVVYQVGEIHDQVVKVASRPHDDVFGSPITLSSSGDSGDAQVAVDAAGNTAAVWTRFDGTRETVEGSYRPAGGSFAAATTLTKANFPGNVPAVAIDSSGAATATWETTNLFGIVWTSTFTQGTTPPPPGEEGGPKEGGPKEEPHPNNGTGGIQSGGNSSGGSNSGTPSTPNTTPSSKPVAPLKCRKGFKKKTVGGKPRCVRATPKKTPHKH